ncbi:hypothetical protein G2W53_011256 [Senna tora]|uniref:Uncharacterized protein n=1 Tax=Senna tora TaxID=362788 RepID=A0A834X2K4_9FABA|nr:hypothetical protein G2W53_011256 [Senna tora]
MPLSFVLSKNPLGSTESKSNSSVVSNVCFEFSSVGGLFTTQRNLCSLLSNASAISFNCDTVNDPRLPKHRYTTLLLGCLSSHNKQLSSSSLLRFWLKLFKSIHKDPVRFRKMRAEIQEIPISRVVPIEQRFHHVCGLEWWITWETNLDFEILEALVLHLFVMDLGEIQESGKNSSSGGEEVVNGDPKGSAEAKCGRAEEINDHSSEIGGLGDLGERGSDVGCIKANEIESHGGDAAREGGIEGDEGETEEGDGGVGLGDAVDVGGDGSSTMEMMWPMPGAGYRTMVSCILVEKKMMKNNVFGVWSCLLHSFCGASVRDD